MGIFDKLSGTDKIKITPKVALALAAMTMIGIDGIIDDEEIITLRRIIKGDDQTFNNAYNIYKDQKVSDCVPLVSNVLDEKQKIAVIAILIDIAMSDGILAGSEKDLLTLYIESFQISEEILNDIVEVIALKNDFSIFE